MLNAVKCLKRNRKDSDKMAEIRPFSALRYTEKAGDVKTCVCPPYDIISPKQKEEYLKTNPHNIIKLELPGTDYADYERAATTLDSWKEDGILKQDECDSIYAYEEEFTALGKKYSFRGIVCRVKLYEFSENVVLPHEETLSKAKEDRFCLMNATGCNISQIYSLYSDKEGVTAKTVMGATNKAPENEFTDGDGVTHRMWRITDKAVIDEICDQFKERKLYIADGHHRYETALRYKKSVYGRGDSGYVMMFLIDMENDGLVVFPTHRIIRGIENYSTEKLIAGAKENFAVEKLESRDEISARLSAGYEKCEKVFGYYDGKESYLFTLKNKAACDKAMPNASEALKGLDVSVLHTLLLEQVLKIDKENMAKQINLTYTRDEAEAYAAADGEANACFIINPTRIDEIAAVAAAGEKMPQKSTYFYPKLITGLVMNKIF